MSQVEIFALKEEGLEFKPLVNLTYLENSPKDAIKCAHNL
jgi:hypothetical protein